MTKSAPLEGLKVLDVSSVLSGPLTTMLLADLGADVIKVEPPSAPDFTRGTGQAHNEMTAYFYNTNRGKRAIAVDGEQPLGQKSCGNSLMKRTWWSNLCVPEEWASDLTPMNA